ncbi:MAG: TlyA family RNA methyltransferase [Hyphomicrobiaceae bacterium]
MTLPHRNSSRQRLDLALVERGLVVTRARARDLVLRGEVSVDGQVATKPAAMVGRDSRLELVGGSANYVSRGTLKLRAALLHFGFDATGRTTLDIGASTGGFTEVLLEGGARRVYAVENGQGQLHPRLAGDSRVVSLERTDARTLDRSMIGEPIGAIVADVSFISLTKVLPAALPLATPDCWLAALIKPQFEGDPHTIPRDGIVKDESARDAALVRVAQFIGQQVGWRVVGSMPSPIHGGDGNVEYLIGAVLDG